jgi:DNA-binding HxlR family transcriptional regulator
VPTPDELDTGPDTSLVEGLFGFQLARPVLRVLAEGGPRRYRDLRAALAARPGGQVYSRTLENALSYLCQRGLVVRDHEGPRVTVLRITNRGLAIQRILSAMQLAVDQTAPPQRPPAGAHQQKGGLG